MPPQATRPDDGMLPRFWPLGVTLVLWGASWALGALFGAK